MKKMDKPKKLETRKVDSAECPWCGVCFSGEDALNYELGQEKDCECPNCGKKVAVYPSVEYQCRPLTDVYEDIWE